METMQLLRRFSCVLLLLLLSSVVVANSNVDTTSLAAVEAQAAAGDDAVVVVSLGGTGNYRSIGAAIAAAPLKSGRAHVIHIKSGVYKEYITITRDMWNITLVGDGMDRTVITGDRSAARGYSTMASATVAVFGRGFIARDLTIKNTAGASSGQAVALMSESEKSILYRCSLMGYQDTLYARSNKQFYRECHISGTVDFIFGDAAAVFQNYKILARLPLLGQGNTITAQGRDDASSLGGFVFQFCTIVADADLLHANFTVNTYLGRPWRVYARVVFLKSFMSSIVHPDGWLQWNSTMRLDLLYYAEFKNTGPGSHTGGRVHWTGVHNRLGGFEASKFTVPNFISGNSWLPGTGIPFTPGL